MAAVAVKVVISACLFVVVVSTAWFIAILLDYYAVDAEAREVYHVRDSQEFTSDKLRNMFWFVQVSDIHLSKYRPGSKADDLRVFINENIKQVIKPDLVLVTGDITDAKDASKISSDQLLEEWEVYKSILTETQITEHTVWLDIRGNHDAFSVPSHGSKENLFSQYSVSGPQLSRGSGSFQYVHNTSFGSYSFNALDACPDPGPRRPFNFFGVLDEERLQQLKDLAQVSSLHNQTIWYGHYPTSTILNQQVKEIISSGSVYLCGHLHTLAGVFHQMHAVYPQGHLQLELGDWTQSRRYRVMAVDHDLVSFVDVDFGVWPVLLVTNPKDAHYLIPHHEPLHLINKSTHIRILAFSTAPLSQVSVSIDGQASRDAVHVSGALYALPWIPEDYGQGLHSLVVEAKDERGRHSRVEQQFSVDGTRPLLDFFPAVVLLTDFATLFCVVFCLSILMLVVGFGALRFFSTSLVNDSRVRRSWFSCLVLLSRSDSLFYPLQLYTVYLLIGPWFVGKVIVGNVGVVTVHGIYVYGRWIPGSLTYLYGIFQLVTFNVPLLMYLGHVLRRRQQRRGSEERTNRHLATTPPWWKTLPILSSVVLLLILGWQASSSYHVYKAYGLMSFLLCPAKTWSLILALMLVRKAHKVTL